jgi:hypothetical protein
MTEKNHLVELLLHVKNRPVLSLEKTYDTSLQEWEDWYGELVGKTQALALSLAKEPALRKRLFKECAYIDMNGKPAYVCTTCRYYHGFKRGCEWKMELLGGCREEEDITERVQREEEDREIRELYGERRKEKKQ